MKKIILSSFLFLCTSLIIGQDYVFFNDSPTDDFYDVSWGYANSPSTLTLLGADNNKAPISTEYKFAGLNSLKLQWNSKAGGDWGLAIAGEGWARHDITKRDSIIFFVFSNEFITASNLPKIYLEDITNQKTNRFNLSEYHGNVNSQVWQRVAIPLQIFKSNPNGTDLTNIKTVFFGQNETDGNEHILFIDELRMISATSADTINPAIPQNIAATGYDSHIEIEWTANTETDISGYNIYKQVNSEFQLIDFAEHDVTGYIDFIGQSRITAEYKIAAIDKSLNESDMSDEVYATTYEMNDDELLDILQKYTFRYFWDYAHPISGLTRERLGSGNIVTSGGTGMGLMSIIVGIERGFITREEGAERLLKMVRFLKDAERFHGAWSHWLNGATGKAIPFSQHDDGGDLVETAYVVEGLLVAREYFDQSNLVEDEIRSVSTQLWEDVEWDWYRRTESGSALYWHWSPNHDWRMNMQIRGFNETMITYLLAIASPTHSVPSSLYHTGWAGNNYENGKTFYNIKLDVGSDYVGPLFFVHYSFLGFDPRNKKDKYTNYFNYARNASLVHQQYSIENPKGYTGYDENTWGLTASDDPLVGYTAHAPMYNDNGTITPTAALSSFPYTPEESMAAFKNFYRNYGKSLFGTYGFKDAFNPSLDWTAESYLAIDQGPVLIMIENYRSQLVWNMFMSNPEITPMLDSIGFVDDITNVKIKDKLPTKIELKQNFPNPFNPTTIIKYSIPPKSILQSFNMDSVETDLHVTLKVHDALGREISTLVNETKPAGNYEVQFDGSTLTSGTYYYQIKVGNLVLSKKMILLK